MQAFHSGHGYPTLTPTPADGATTQPIANGVVCAIDFTGTERPFQQPYTTLRFGTTNPPDVVLSSWPGAHDYQPGDVAYRFRYAAGSLAPNTTYYWQVAVGTIWGYISSPVWSFDTNALPVTPFAPSPNDAGDTELSPTLTWVSTYATSYDVYFGTSASPPLVSTGQAGATYTPSGPLVDATVYYWKIVAHNAYGVTTGPVWVFTAGDTMVLDKDVTLQDVVNTAVETTVYTFSVPGGTLSTNRALRLTIVGDYLNNSGASRNFSARVYYGGTIIGACILSGGAIVLADANRRSFRGNVVISAMNATNIQASVHSFNMGATGTATGGGATPFAQVEGCKNNGAIDSTASQTLAVTFEHPVADVNLSARALVVWVEKL